MSIRLQINFLTYLTNKQEKFMKESNRFYIHKENEMKFRLIFGEIIIKSPKQILQNNDIKKDEINDYYNEI